MPLNNVCQSNAWYFDTHRISRWISEDLYVLTTDSQEYFFIPDLFSFPDYRYFFILSSITLPPKLEFHYRSHSSQFLHTYKRMNTEKKNVLMPFIWLYNVSCHNIKKMLVFLNDVLMYMNYLILISRMFWILIILNILSHSLFQLRRQQQQQLQ